MARQFVFTVAATALILATLLVFGIYTTRVFGQNTSGLGASTPCYVKAGLGTTNDNTNHAVCKTAPGVFKGVRAVNTSASLAFVLMYNTSADPGATPVSAGFVECIAVPASTTGAGIVDFVSNFQYTTGISYIINGTCSNSSQSNPPAGVLITLKYD